ncbi:hypothetical protein [Marinactinospora rubrisoli]|uniref:Uncharacterized protein n=1 Tax=Marinactinospora rubrisoli TaxID=2715399 RepID=A0ABW2KN47_9ACTN
MTDWIRTIRREEERQIRQRASSANRRAAAIEEGQRILGSYRAVAEELGVSPQAVTDARQNAERRTRHEPMADYLELDLPQMGAAVPTEQEWLALPEDERPAAARQAAMAWKLIWIFALRTAEDCHLLAEKVAELGNAHHGDRAALREAMRETLPEWGKHLLTEDDHLVLMHLMADLSKAFGATRETALKEHEIWQDRADGPA